MHKNVSTISVVGLGKLGAPMVACFAAKGYRVIGVDINPRNVKLINQGRAPTVEPDLDELLHTHRERISATQDYEEAVLQSSITFVIVPTPSNGQGSFSIEYAQDAMTRIGEVLRHKSEWHLVVLTSTVMPGSTEQDILPILEAYSGKKCGKDFGLCYNPEFIALGSVIRDFLNPDFLLVGESDARSGEMLEQLYQNVCEGNPPVARMNFVNAELAKLAVNTFVTTKITFANTLARICEQLPGSDVDVVTSALGLDSRIGAKYLKGAIGYGGPCFPRDNIALAALTRQIGVPAWLAEATDRVNRAQVNYLTNLIKSKMTQGGTVGILGLSYKPDTNVVEESQGILLAQTLISEGIPVTVYDPAAMDNARQVLDHSAQFAESLTACIQTADVVVITTPWNVFRQLEPSLLERVNKPQVLIDCWRILNQEQFKDVVDYIALGMGNQSEQVEEIYTFKLEEIQI